MEGQTIVQWPNEQRPKDKNYGLQNTTWNTND